MHTRFFAGVLLVLALFFPQAARATGETAFSCPALRDKHSYDGEYEQFLYLLPGKEGWFFRTEQDLRTDFSFRHENEQLLAGLSKYFKNKGIDLVIAYPMLRGIAAHQFAPVSDPLAKGYNPSMALHNYKKLIGELNEDDVHIIGNPEIKSGAGYFLKADQHWTPAGAEEMARAVADYVKTLSSYQALPKTEYATKILPEVMNEPSFNVVLQGLCKKKAPPEKVTLTETSAVKKADEKALLGEIPDPQVVLVGTSNSKHDLNDANFSGRLKEFLSADVDNAAVTGGGVDDSLLGYLSSARYKNHPPKIIIWEIPPYYDLDGSVVRSMLRQFQPSVFRACDKPLAQGKGLQLGNLGQTIPDSPPYYLGVKFGEKVSKKFNIVFTFDDGSKDETEIKFPVRAYPADNSLYYTPKVPHGAHLSSVKIEGAGTSGDMSLCAFPQAAAQ